MSFFPLSACSQNAAVMPAHSPHIVETGDRIRSFPLVYNVVTEDEKAAVKPTPLTTGDIPLDDQSITHSQPKMAKKTSYLQFEQYSARWLSSSEASTSAVWHHHLAADSAFACLFHKWQAHPRSRHTCRHYLQFNEQ